MIRRICIIVVVLGCAGIFLSWRSSEKPIPFGAVVGSRCIKHIGPGESCLDKEATEAQRQALDKGIKWYPEGFYEIMGESAVVKVVDSALVEAARRERRSEERNSPEVRAEAQRCAPASYTVRATIENFPGHWVAVYADQQGRRIMLTRADFYAYGGKVGGFEHNHRVRVNDNLATAILVLGANMEKVIWDVSWISGGAHFDLEVEDIRGGSGRGKYYDVAAVLRLAEAVDSKCHWFREAGSKDGLSEWERQLDLPDLDITERPVAR